MFSVIFIPEYCRVWKLLHGDCISMMCFQTNDLFMYSHYIPPEGSKNATFPVFPWNRKNKINFPLKLAMESKSVLACSNTIFKNIITLSDTYLSHKLVNSNRLIKHMLCRYRSNYFGKIYFWLCPSHESFNDLVSLFLHCYFHLTKKGVF